MKMDKTEFKQLVLEELKRRGLSPEICDSGKLNQEGKEVIRINGTCIIMRVAVDMIYEDYLNGDSIPKICQGVVEGWHEQQSLNKEILDSHIDLWPVAKNYIHRQVLSKSMNLNTVLAHHLVYNEYLDFVVTYFVNLKDQGVCMNVTREALAVWGVKEQDIYQACIDNEKDWFDIRSMAELWCGDDIGFKKRLFGEEPDMFVLTNSKCFLAAAGILNADILEQAYRRLENHNYFLLPSSIHDLILVPDFGLEELQTEASDLKEIVLNVNETVRDEERLTNSVYYYNHETREVRIVG